MPLWINSETNPALIPDLALKLAEGDLVYEDFPDTNSLYLLRVRAHKGNGRRPVKVEVHELVRPGSGKDLATKVARADILSVGQTFTMERTGPKPILLRISYV